MLQLKAGLLLFIGCWMGASSEQETFCHRRSSKPGLHFTDRNGPADLVIGCESEWTDIICCTSNYRKIVWYQSTDKKTWREFMLIHNNDSRTISKDEQVASIKSLQRRTDSGYYRCVAHGYNEGEIIEAVAAIDIRNCSDWSEPPIPLNPRSNLTYVNASEMESVNIMCSSFSGFNCDEYYCDYGWYRRYMPLNDTGLDQIPETNSSLIRIRFTKYFSRKGLRMEAVLSIENITTDDYIGEFVCFASNDIGFAYRRMVRLKPRLASDIRIKVSVAVVGGITVVVIVMLLLVNSRIRADLDFRIWWRKRLIKNLQDAADYDYDVTLLFSGNEPFARYLKQALERDFQLNIFSMNDLNPGMAPISCLSEYAKRSRCVLAVITPEVNEDKDFVAIVGDIIADVTPVFVLYGVSSADTDANPPRLDRNIVGAMAVRPPLRWPGTVCEVAAIPSYGLGPLEDEHGVEYWEGSGKRQVRIFWKKLRLSLLTMEKARVAASRNISESEPLLFSSRNKIRPVSNVVELPE